MSTLGSINPQSMLSDDLYNVEQDTDKLISDEINTLRKPSNLFRILGSMAGVSAIQIYNGTRDIKTLGFSAGLMGLSTVASMQLSGVLSYKGYVTEDREEHIILPASMGIYYLIANRSLNLRNVNNAVALQSLAGGLGSFGADAVLNKQKPPSQ